MTSEPNPPIELDEALERLHGDSFGWALSCCGWDDAEAEDVLQTAYLKVISGQATFGGRSTFRTWLFGVIRRKAQEFRRRARSREARAEAYAREVDPVAPGAGADAAVVRSEESRLLLEALRVLPERQREVLQLVFYQGLTIREAAEVMEVSIGSARVHYERGKKRLRSLLAEEGILE